MKLSDRIVVSGNVVAREVGGETMLLNLSTGTYFGLDAVGGRFWQLLEQGKSGPEARDVLLDEYEVARDVLDHDLEALLGDLVANGLVAAGS